MDFRRYRSFIFAGLAFFLIKFLGPILLVNSGIAQVFLHASPAANLDPRDYALGCAEEWAGVLTQLIGGIAFAMYCLRFLKDASLKEFAGAAFVYLLLTKWEVLFNPPYGDPISGPWVEAVWLSRHHFDYAGLLQQPGHPGGAKIYVLSIYPGLLALLMKVIPSVKIFLLINHLLTFAMSALIVAIVRTIGNKYFTKTASCLLALIVMAMPLFQSMTEGINMEIPSLFFLMLTIWALSNRKFGLAAIFAIVDTLTKGTGVIACLTVVMTVCLDAFLGKETGRVKRKNLAYGAMVMAFVVLQVFLKRVIGDSTAHDMGFLGGWEAVSSTYLFRLIMISFGICAIVLCMNVQGRSVGMLLKEVWEKYYSALLIFMATLNWMLLFINMIGLSPRYKIMLCALLVFTCVFAVHLLFQHIKWMGIVLWSALGVTLVSSYGLLEKRPTDTHFYEYLLLDRSLEYRNDLKMYMKVDRELEGRFADFRIGAPFILVHTLAIPELGYVSRPLHAMSYAVGVQYEGIEQFSALENIDPMHTVWVGFKGEVNPVVAEVCHEFPIDHQKDLVLKDVGFGGRYGTLFMGGFAVDCYQKVFYALMQSGKLKSTRKQF